MKPWHDKTPASGKSCPPNSSVQCIMICTSNHVLTVSYIFKSFLVYNGIMSWRRKYWDLLSYICQALSVRTLMMHVHMHILRYIEIYIINKYWDTLRDVFWRNSWESLISFEECWEYIGIHVFKQFLRNFDICFQAASEMHWDTYFTTKFWWALRALVLTTSLCMWIYVDSWRNLSTS